MNKTFFNPFENKSVLVLGLGKSGQAISKFLLSKQANITISVSPDVENNKILKHFSGKKNVSIIANNHPIELLELNFDYIVKSPGIPYSIPILQEAIKRNVDVLTEPEIIYPFLDKKNCIAITGSNGKTTTTTLINYLLQNSGLSSVACGNIGYPLSSAITTSIANLVMELSSFQLKGVKKFRPNIAVLLNITTSHLDYHRTLDDYCQSKSKITQFQDTNDYLIFNYDDIAVRSIAQKSKANKIPFSTKEFLNYGACVKDGFFYLHGNKFMNLNDVRIPGTHNQENYLSALLVADLMEIPQKSVIHSFNCFSGVEHRLQFVGEVNERRFYNDSKATNVTAATNAINSFGTAEVILIAGGLDRGNNFEDFIPALRRCKSVYLFGETAERIKLISKKNNLFHTHICKNLNDAVNQAYASSSPGDKILLSPACASWDQYKSFEERGNQFIKLFRKIK